MSEIEVIPGAPAVAVFRADQGQTLPDVRMRVNEGNNVSPSGEDRMYEGGEEIVVDGPTALALMQAGHATVVGTVEPPAEEAPAE